MQVTKIACPSCSASVSVPEGSTQIRCPFCATSLAVARNDSTVALSIAEQMAESVRTTGKSTESAIRDGTNVTRDELRQLQKNQALSTLRLQLTQIQRELRALERMVPDGVIRRQLGDLRQEESEIRAEIARLDGTPPPKQKENKRQGNTYTLPSSGWATGVEGWVALSLGFTGEIGRQQFWQGLAIPVLLLIPFSLITPYTESSTLASIFGTLLFLIIAWSWMALAVKRLRDRKKSPFWLLLSLIPFFGLLFLFIEFGFFPGREE